MAHDFELEPGLTFGDWLFREISDVYHLEEVGWAAEATRRVADLLPAARPGETRLEVVVPWMRSRTAFTAPGRYIYFGRGLLERCPDDEMIAFVVAHEIAHHDLGHLRLIPDWMPRAAQRFGGAFVAAAVMGLERRIYGPERECAADRHGLELCLEAGYDPERCLAFFHIMELIALDLGDSDMFYGPDPDSDAELAPDAPWQVKARIWAWQRTRGYLPIQDRVAQLRRFLGARSIEQRTA